MNDDGQRDGREGNENENERKEGVKMDITNQDNW